MAKQKHLNINEQVSSDPIRLIDDEGQQHGVVSLQQAREIAQQAGLDLVEISPNASPAVCRVMNYGKHLYSESKKRQDAKKKQKQIVVKEIKFRPGTDIGDYTIKLKKLTEFLSAGNKAKVTMRFRGREMNHKELGLEMLKRIQVDLHEVAEVEQQPALEGRQMVMVLAPNRESK